MTNLEIVRNKLKQQVPLVGHMQVDIAEYQPGQVIVEAPLQPNINTHGTAFGGSLYCIATMCGWSLVHLTLLDAGYQPSVWVTAGSIEYFKPVTGLIRAQVSARPDQLEPLLASFNEKQRGRVNLEIEILNDEQLAVKLSASYAARQ